MVKHLLVKNLKNLNSSKCWQNSFKKEKLQQADIKKITFFLMFHLIVIALFTYRITVNLIYEFLRDNLLTLIRLSFLRVVSSRGLPIVGCQ